MPLKRKRLTRRKKAPRTPIKKVDEGEKVIDDDITEKETEKEYEGLFPTGKKRTSKGVSKGRSHLNISKVH